MISAFLIGGPVFLCLVSVASAQIVAVKIIDRQDRETGYSYTTPGSIESTSHSDANCYGGSSSVNCSGTTRTTGTVTAPRTIAYSVTGSTLSLLLPDGRIAVVNCASKYAFKMDHVNRRSCRIPLVNDVQAEFKGKDAKLSWPVSLDGKKVESETYKVIAIQNKQ